MPTQYNMKESDDLYRAILEYEVQPTKVVRNPHYDPRATNADPDYRKNEKWRETIRVPDGPKATSTSCIGPYGSVAPIKSYITRNRGRYDNLRIKSIQKATGWEEVDG